MKFQKYLERKNSKVSEKPKVIKVGDCLSNDDTMAGEPNKPPKEPNPMKDGKQAQVKEGWAKFLERKGIAVDKPAIEIIADYPDKSPAAPPSAVTKGKHWNANAPKASKPLPYKNPNTDPGQQTAKEGLGNLGSIPKEEIVLKAGDSPNIPGGKSVGDYTTKTEQFLKRTKDMPISQFSKYILKEELAVDGEIYHDVPQAIKYITYLCQNKNILRDMILEFKKCGLLENTLKTVMENSESYAALVDLLGDKTKGPSRCHALVKAMNEVTSSPIGIDDDEEEISDEDMPPEDFEDEEEDEDYPEDEEDGDYPEDEDEEDDESPEEEEGELSEPEDELNNLGAEPQLGKKICRGRLAMDHLIHAINQYLIG